MRRDATRRTGRRGRSWQVLVILLNGLGLFGSGMFIFIMSRLPVTCTWCMAAHAMNFLLFALAMAAWFVSPRDDRAPRPTGARVAGVSLTALAGLALLFVAGRAYTYQRAWVHFQRLYQEATNDVDYIAWRHASAPQQQVTVRPDDVRMGPANAPHTLVIFSDFECAACAQLHDNLDGLAGTFPDALQIVLKHYPVSRSCNPHVSADLHYFACDAATAAEAARMAGESDAVLRFWSLLFRNRGRLDERPYQSLAKRAGLNLSEFESARRSDAARERVAADIALAHSLGVEETPAMFLDGRRLGAWNIVTNDLSPRPNKAETRRLWERLLGMDTPDTGE